MLYFHAISGEPIQGLRLAPGAVLREEDQHDSTCGTWEQCPCPELELGWTDTIWIRPIDLSSDAKTLLAYLALNNRSVCVSCERPLQVSYVARRKSEQPKGLL